MRIESIRKHKRAIIRRYHKTGYLNKTRTTSKVTAWLLIAIVIIFLVSLPATCKPDEPWYYLDQSDYRFMVPDKFQHFYGCYAITAIAHWPAATLLAITKECMDAAAGQEFSRTDLIADGLGIVSALLNNKAEILGQSPRSRIVAFLDWRQSRDEIIFFVKLKF